MNQRKRLHHKRRQKSTRFLHSCRRTQIHIEQNKRRIRLHSRRSSFLRCTMSLRKQINSGVARIIEAGYVPITKRSSIQAEYGALIIGNGRKNAGMIRTLEEYNAFQTKMLGKNARTITRKEYNIKLKDFYEKNFQRLSLGGEKFVQRERRKAVMQDVEKATGERYNPDLLTDQELSELMRRTSQRIRAEASSNNFYTYLEEEIYDYLRYQ